MIVLGKMYETLVNRLIIGTSLVKRTALTVLFLIAFLSFFRISTEGDLLTSGMKICVMTFPVVFGIVAALSDLAIFSSDYVYIQEKLSCSEDGVDDIVDYWKKMHITFFTALSIVSEVLMIILAMVSFVFNAKVILLNTAATLVIISSLSHVMILIYFITYIRFEPGEL